MAVVRVASVLRAPPEVVWADVRTLDGVNRELAPWMRMGAPAAWAAVPLDEVPLGVTLLRSPLLAFGVVPFDLHALRLVAVEGASFRERSTSCLQAAWAHDRRVVPHPDGCVLVDEVEATPRLPGVGPIVDRVVRELFAHRHRVLRTRYGGGPTEAR